jgi:hypothetical protein
VRVRKREERLFILLLPSPSSSSPSSSSSPIHAPLHPRRVLILHQAPRTLGLLLGEII